MSDDSDTDISKSAHRGIAWASLASSLVGVLDIIATILIVGLWLTKEQFGIAVLAISIFPVLDIVTDLGLAAAVIQRDDHSRSRISTVFWLNVAMSGLLFALLALGIGPLIAHIQGKDVIAGLLTAYGAKLIWQNVYFLPYALMKKELRFKELSVIRIIANVAEFVGKVGAAASGLGVWCFIVGPLCRVFVTGIGVQIRHPWRPSFVFKWSEGWDWAKFGLKTSAHKVLFRLYSVIDKQVVGFYFGKEALAVYSIAYLVVLEPAHVISEIIVNVAFPTFAKLKHSTEKLFEQLVSFCKMNMVVMLLFVGIIFVGAEEILAIFDMRKDADVLVSYTTGAPIVRVLCGIAVLRALSFVIPPLLDGVGRPTLTLIYTSVAAVALTFFFLVFAHLFGEELGAFSVALAWLFGYPIAFGVLVWLAFSILEMPSHKLYTRLAGIAGCGLLATLCAACAKWILIDTHIGIRIAGIAGTMIVSYAALLSRFQGINIRSVRSSLSSD